MRVAELCAHIVQYQVKKKPREKRGYNRSRVSGRDAVERGDGTASAELVGALGLQRESHFLGHRFVQFDEFAKCMLFL